MKRDYEKLYKNSLKIRKRLQNKVDILLEDKWEIEIKWMILRNDFNDLVTKKVNEYVNNYEGWLKNEVERWKRHYHKAMQRLEELETEIERLRDERLAKIEEAINNANRSNITKV